MKMITVTIDGKQCKVTEGTTVLNAATQNGIKIPNLCYDGRVELYGACGLCVIETENSPKLQRACSTKVFDGMVVKTNSERITRARKTALELLLSDHDGDCKAPCTLACPANTDCQGYVGLIANGEYKEAVKLIKEKIPLPASIGRICPHPCEKKCRRQYVDEPIAIAGLKAFAADMDMLSADSYVPNIEPDTGKKIAVIGGGPGGLTAAYFLRQNGHSVTVFDMMPKMGGMLRYGIPEYRLPKKLLDKEIRQIKSLGVQMKNNVKFGKDIILADLQKKYDAVVLAAGAWSSTSMRVPGEELTGVVGGIDFLREVALGHSVNIGKNVAVVGGGNTAMDACRTAVRLGAENVYVIYRRTKNEMPAEAIEIEEAEEEGVTFSFLTNPIEFIGKKGKLESAKLQKMELGEPDASGRRRPVPIPNAVETIKLDTVIMAIGQHPDLEGFEQFESTKKGTVAADESTFRTSVDGVFAVGDLTNKGADIAVSAIGEAQKAAVVIDRYLMGETVGYKKPFYVHRDIPMEYFDKFPKAERAKTKSLKPEIRKTNFKEVAKGFTPEQAQKEAMRCLECGCHDFYECKLISYANEYEVKPEKFEGEKHHRNIEVVNDLITRNTDKCILCGLCVRVCEEAMGKTNLGLIGRGFDTIVQPEYGLPLDESSCMYCGQCVTVCPTGALLEKQPQKKNLTVKENKTKSVCNFCSALCPTEIRSIGRTVTRSLPYGDLGLLCKGGRFGIFAAENKNVVKESLDMRKLEWAKSALSKCTKDEIAVIVGSTATLEEIFVAKQITENVFSELNKNSAAYDNAKFLGVKPMSEFQEYDVVIECGTHIPNISEEIEFVIALDSIDNKESNIFIPTATFTSDEGTYLKGKKIAQMHPSVASICPTKLSVLAALADISSRTAKAVWTEITTQYPELEKFKENDIIKKAVIQKGGAYQKITDDLLIRTFKETM